ncbi:MAG: hypothetical protein K0R38_1963 [Polyangiaceae bacterium]|nr:hypothetical protein [Polyangiaceae bacterium]
MRLLRRTLSGLMLSSALSCSAASPAAATPPAPAPMPPGNNWRGLYQGPYHLILNIWAEGTRAQGNWRAVGDREGMFTGTVNGNLLVFDWTERARDKQETWSGSGYFVYSAAAPDRPAEIFGEWGMGSARKVSSWWAKKRAEEPLRSERGRIDRDADQQYQDDASGCEMAGCDTSDQDGK